MSGCGFMKYKLPKVISSLNGWEEGLGSQYGRHGNIMHLGNVTEDVLEKYQLINYS